MIGVTGTKGKTTTTHMIKSVLEAAGRKVGMMRAPTACTLWAIVEEYRQALPRRAMSCKSCSGALWMQAVILR